MYFAPFIKILLKSKIVNSSTELRNSTYKKGNLLIQQFVKLLNNEK